MDKLNEVIAEIELQGKNYTKFSNNWNVMQQLIDILAYMPESAEIVLQNLKIKEMQLTALVQKITGKRLADPMKVMEEICDFYKIEVPDVLYPRNFRKAHDEAYKIIKDKEFKDSELPQIARQYAGYKKLYGFEDKDFIITPPTRHNDIKDEGKQLMHCVATYARSVATAKTIILFIRKKTEPDKPFFTLELNPDTLSIKQCRGLKNCAYPQSVKKFMDKWIKEKIEPIKRSREKCQTVA